MTVDPLQVLAVKLKLVKKALIMLNTSNGNLSSNVDEARSALHATQIALTS